MVTFALTVPKWGNHFLGWQMWGWGLLGGAASLTSPAILFAWLAMTLRYVCLQVSENRKRVRTVPASDGATSKFATIRDLVFAVFIAFTIQMPWLIRNYLCFSTIVPIKTNGLFELEQSLLRDDDGVLDFRRNVNHPYSDMTEAKKHASVGEIDYVRERAELLKSRFWENKWLYAKHCNNRIIAMLFWILPPNPGDEAYIWYRFVQVLYALPWIVFLSSLGTRIPITTSQRSILLLAGAYLLPYALLSYYSRYMIPLMGIRCLVLIWGIMRWSKWLRHRRFLSRVRVEFVSGTDGSY